MKDLKSTIAIIGIAFAAGAAFISILFMFGARITGFTIGPTVLGFPTEIPAPPPLAKPTAAIPQVTQPPIISQVTQQPIISIPTATTVIRVTPTPVEVKPLRNHVTTSIGTGVFGKATFSDGQAPNDENWLWANNHFNIQRIRREENPDGCGSAQYQVNKIWIGVAAIAKVTVNGSEIGTITTITPLQRHGYIVDVSLNVGDKICVSPIPDAGFQIVFGPDIYYHHDSYCYRGNC